MKKIVFIAIVSILVLAGFSIIRPKKHTVLSISDPVSVNDSVIIDAKESIHYSNDSLIIYYILEGHEEDWSALLEEYNMEQINDASASNEAVVKLDRSYSSEELDQLIETLEHIEWISYVAKKDMEIL